MALFSFGLLIIVTGFLALLGFYENGTESRVVQTAARNGINSIVDSGRQAQYFYYNNTAGVQALCMTHGSTNSGPSSIFYVSGTQLNEGGWNNTTACVPASAISPASVTSPDAQVKALLLDPTDNIGGSLIPSCTTGPCPSTQLVKSIRITLKVTSNVNDLDGTGSNCSPSAPAYCVVTVLSTTLTAGEL